MDANITLRDRRRMQTERDIQDAALALTYQHGFDGVTTEMIADAASISIRTFFNYYPNKEAAIVGPQAGFDDGLLADFGAMNGTLVDDFVSLVTAQFEISQPRKDVIQAIDKVLGANPALQAAFARSLEKMTDQLAAALQPRQPASSPQRFFLATVLMKAVAEGSIAWGHAEKMSVDDLITMIRELLGFLQLELSR
ncbi:TetR/AcrR family transcriptional regulator [Qingshengfaniella alkalisoli]|nr:TetR/AcrR family transcriptional regulator [Qingshengfaniella alkalisoli]